MATASIWDGTHGLDGTSVTTGATLLIIMGIVLSTTLMALDMDTDHFTTHGILGIILTTITTHTAIADLDTAMDQHTDGVASVAMQEMV